MKQKRLKALFFQVIVALIWGAAGPIIKYTLQYIPPVPFLTYRFLLSALLACIFLIKPQKNNLNYKSWSIITITSIISLPLALILFFTGFDKTTAVNGSLLTALTPIITSVMGAFFLKEIITSREKVGSFLTFGGALMLVILPNLNGSPLKQIHLAGNLLVLGAIFADSIGAILSKTMLKMKISASLFTNIGFIISFLCMLPVILYFYDTNELYILFKNLPYQAHLGVLYMALISGTLAYWLRNISLKNIEVSEASVVWYLIPVFGLPLSILWLGESFSMLLIPGIIVTVLGILYTEKR